MNFSNKIREGDILLVHLLPSNCNTHTRNINEFIIFGLLVAILLITIFVESRQFSCISSKCSPNSIHSLPGPIPFPMRVIGNLFQLPKPQEIISKSFEWCAKYGPCFRLTLFKQDFVVISSAPLAQSVLQSNDLGHLTKTDVYHFLEGIEGLAFTKGTKWRTMRKISAQAFSYQRIDRQIEIFNKHGDRLVETFLNGKKECKTSNEFEIANCTVQMIIETFISQPNSCSYSESLEYIKNWKRYTDISAYRIINPYLGLDFIWRRHPLQKEFKKVIENVNNFADVLIQRYRQSHNESNDKSLLSELLGLNYSLEEIRDEVVAMLFAHETNFLGLYYLLYMLAIHPEHQTQCQKEVDEIFDGQEDTIISSNQLARLKYLERCLFEAMRLLPPVYIFGRKLETPLKLSNRVLLPAGTNCLVLPIVIHKTSEYWHGDTSVFNPDRFLPENCSKRHAYAYLPFSAGPRICLGMKSSIANVKIVAAKVLRKFWITSDCKFEDIKFRLNLTMDTEQDLDLQFTPRRR